MSETRPLLHQVLRQTEEMTEEMKTGLQHRDHVAKASNFLHEHEDVEFGLAGHFAAFRRFG